MHKNIRLNTNNIKNLITQKYRNNLTWFAEEIGVDRSYLSLALNNRKENKKYSSIALAIIIYCLKNKLNINEYIFFN